jgi:signal recognition particle subunit SRP54
MAAKLSSGTDFTLEDFLSQLQAVQKMGSIGKLLGMLPGMSEHKEAINNLDDREFDRIRAIIQSMTPAERADVKVLNASRRQRIAAGSGTQVSDVNQLVNRFLEARKMMSQMAKGGGIPGMPGMPGLPGGMGGPGGGRPKKGKKAAKGKKGKVSGNPAKRAQQLAGRQAGPADGSLDAGEGPAGAPPNTLGDLPDAFTDLLGR